MTEFAGLPLLAWVVGGGVLAACLLLVMALGGDGDRDVKRRIARVAAGDERRHSPKSGPSVRIDVRDAGKMPLLDGLMKAVMPNPQRIRDRLDRTGRRIPLGEYLLVNLVAIVVVALLLWQLLGLPVALSMAGGVIAGVGLPHMAVRALGDRRVGQFIGQFPDAVDLIVRGLKSGLPVPESINAVGREMPDPLGIEFRRVADGVRVGKSLDAALWEVAKRIDAPEFRFLIIALAIQRETGGNLGETLSNLSELLRKRKQMKLKIKAFSSEARASAYIVGSLPFLMFGLIYVVNPKYVDVFFTDPRGQVMGIVSLLMIAFGGLVMAKMIRFDP